jgi:hypothetical protein
MFSKIPRKTSSSAYGGESRFYKSVKSSFFGELYEETMNKTITTSYGRGPAFRPSALPLCSILVYMQLVKGASQGYFEQQMSASGGYFTRVGTAAHTNIQYYIGNSGKIWGDWLCVTPGCKHHSAGLNIYNERGKIVRKGVLTRKNTTNNICPACRHPMQYEEKEIRYKGLIGHIDAIVQLTDGTYWVADYKTCTKFKLQSGKLPHKGHLIQLPSYCHVLEKRYKMKISGFSLLYFSRDNPFMFYEHSEKWTSNWMRRSGDTIKNERRKFVGGVRAFALRSRQSAIIEKPCSCKEDYETVMDFYEECPMLKVCFKRNKLEEALDAHERQYPYDNAAIARLIPTLQISEEEIWEK